MDRAPLDAAMHLGVEVGGGCPEGRLAEDGTIPEKYPVRVLDGAGYTQRTHQNVIDSDGTLIICFGAPAGGTAQTVAYCIQEGRPHVLIDADELSVQRATCKVHDFIVKFDINVLNVAGPRASEAPLAYQYARSLLSELLRGTEKRRP